MRRRQEEKQCQENGDAREYILFWEINLGHIKPVTVVSQSFGLFAARSRKQRKIETQRRLLNIIFIF